MLKKTMWNLIKIWAFAKRSISIMLSYRLSFAMSFISPLIWVFLFGMFGRVFEGVSLPALSAYGGDYVAYILLGSVFWQFVSIGLNTAASEIEDEAEIGTLEAIFMTPTNVAIVFPGVSMVSLLLTAIFTTITLLCGVLFFNFNIGGGNYALALVIICLTYLSNLGLGMLSAGLSLIFKQVGDLVSIIVTIMMFLAGVYFPVSVMPALMQKLAWFIPLTHALHGVRLALLQDATLIQVAKPIAILGALSIIAIAWGYFVFTMAIKRARKVGSLAYY